MANIPGWLLGSTITLVAGAVLYLARQLWKRWRDRIVDAIDLMLRRNVNRFDRRYREFMLSSLRYIDTKGLATVGFFTPDLDAVFVDVSLAYRAPHQIPEGLLTQISADVTDRHSINDFLDLPDPIVLAVIGVPGSGKTTLLRHTARKICLARRRIPILLYLRDHVPVIVSNSNLPLASLAAHGNTSEPPGWFEQHLRDGDCVILLDGLDEVAKSGDRKRIAAWVESQTKRYPKNRFVITSRPQGYRTAPIEGATVVQVRNFTDNQVAQFVRAWYLAFEKHGTGEAADDLLKRLDANPALYDLTVNPLLLTMIANVHRFRGALPGSRTDLYAEICQVMLGRRQEAKNLPIELSADKKEKLLRSLAFTMMHRRVRDLFRTDIYRDIKPALQRLSTPMTERDLLADLSSNGLLVEREADLFSFAHLTFQEYLAATHIRDKALTQTLAESVDDDWWRETTLLYATRSDADPIVSACLDSGTIPALALAFDIADQDSELDPDLRERLDTWLDSTSDDPARRQLRIGVLLTRHLRDQTRTESGGRVCVRPVTTAIYELFREDTGTPAPDGPDSGPNEPIIGVRGNDAAAFARWINDCLNGEVGYRLPNRAEINDPVIQRALARTPRLTVWLEPHDATERPELWTPPDSAHPNRIDAQQLADRVRSDLALSMKSVTYLLLDASIGTVILAHTLARALDRALARDLARALDLALTLDVNRNLDRDRDLTRDLTRALDLTRDLEHAPDRVRDLGLARGLARARARARDRARDRDLDLARDLTLDLARNRALASPHSRTAVMGTALANALTRSLQKGRPTRDWFHQFTQAFVDETRITTGSWSVSLDTLSDNVRRSREWFQSLSSLAPPTWPHDEVAARLEKQAVPIFGLEQPLSAEVATAVRLAALCLAAEADAKGEGLIGDGYREVAAGVTLMELRAKGEALVTETIMLAVG